MRNQELPCVPCRVMRGQWETTPRLREEHIEHSRAWPPSPEITCVLPPFFSPSLSPSGLPPYLARAKAVKAMVP